MATLTLRLPRIIGLIALTGLALPAMAGPLSAKIDGLKNDHGEVRCGLFAGEEGWRDETRAQRTVNATIQQGNANCDFGDVRPGRYAMAVFHAEQGETHVNYGFLGKPKQGVGFSNNPSIALGAPGFDKAAFSVSEDALELPIQMRY